MNLLAKKKVGWFLAISVAFIGCKDEMRLELTPDVQQTSIEFVELVLPATNLYFDSLRTDDGTIMLVGEYADATFGSVKATGYSEFFYGSGALPSSTISFDTLSFDSITVSLRVSEVLTSATSLIQNLEFYELQDSIFNGVIYLADDVVPLGDLLGSDVSSFNPATLSNLDLSIDTVLAEFRLNDSYGQEFFDFVASLDPSETDTLTGGKIRFPGIGFVSNGSNGVVGYQLLSPLSNINIHMSSPDSTYVIKFQMGSSNKQTGSPNKFTHLDRDRTGSSFSTLTDRRALNVSDDFVYFNPVAGVVPRIDLSPFFDFVKENEQNDIVIQRAQLSIGAKTNQDFLPNVDFSRLYFSKADSSNISDIAFNVNWPGVFGDFLGTLLQNDNTYLGAPNSNALMQLEALETHNEYNVFPNVFFQGLLVQTQSEFDLYSDNLVMVSAINSSLGQSTIYKDSVQLQIFYVKLK